MLKFCLFYNLQVGICLYICVLNKFITFELNVFRGKTLFGFRSCGKHVSAYINEAWDEVIQIWQTKGGNLYFS